MILKYYELNKVNLKKNKSVLFFGSNEGFKNISIKNLIKNLTDLLFDKLIFYLSKNQ